ncbi:MAG: UvrD-helicase domain-containing protein, partial [Candidatus Methanomethylophilaceae archaeon]|nr:UvrD-helicase domain-containing protein [Candidatus Methanomethylophilaceae archaeon]
RGEDYGDFAIIISQHYEDIMDILNKLMSKGILPLKKGWFGIDAEKSLYGDTGALYEKLSGMNVPDGKPSGTRAAECIRNIDPSDLPPGSPDQGSVMLDEDQIKSAVYEDRGMMIDYIHDIFFAFIRRSISDNRLTFGLTASFAFVLLYNGADVRENNRFRYLMIDEFQDTNANQLMISLMILSEPNLCVVGDWKQGIYGFRYVSIENITRFEERAVYFRRFLNDDVRRVGFSIPEAETIPLDVNYRSSQLIIDESFRCLALKDPGSEEGSSPDVTRLSQGRTDLTGDLSSIRYVKTGKDEEAGEVARCISDYLWSGKYTISCRDGTRRKPTYGDIAVICRTAAGCRAVLNAVEKADIPVYLQGDQDIMSAREGKLALAWLRYVNNERDGYPEIMADLGYPLVSIRRVQKDYKTIPEDIRKQRESLYRKRRRVTDLLTSLYEFYGLDNDITHAIITILSEAHRNSLMTLSDFAVLIENDIANGTVYPLDPSISRDAVTIMTMHKSKGLEYPIVIIPFMDSGIMPPKVGD